MCIFYVCVFLIVISVTPMLMQIVCQFESPVVLFVLILIREGFVFRFWQEWQCEQSQ